MNKNITPILVIICLLFSINIPLILADNEAVFPAYGEKDSVYFFYSSTCPHCQAEYEFLESIEKECLNVTIYYLLASENMELFEEFASRYNSSTAGVPRTFIGEYAFVGFSTEEGPLEMSTLYKANIGYSNQIRDAIFGMQDQNNGSCSDENLVIAPKITNLHYTLFGLLLLYGLSFFIFKKKLQNRQIRKYWISAFVLIIIIFLFIFIKSFSEVAIKEFATSLPFPLFAFVIALSDGFNPCAFTVLIILLSLLTYTKDKKDMFIIGITFILTSALMYFLFIMIMVFIGSWAMEKYSHIIMLILGVGVTTAGLINIKDFFFFKKGVSLTMSDENKLKFSSKARKITKSLKESKTIKSLAIAILGTILLSAFVNLVELGCTAILPTIFMTSLIQTYGNTITMNHIIYTLYYAFVYVIPLLCILMNFIYSFKSSRVTEAQGRKLKLFAGLMMLCFGLIMILKPNLLLFN